MTGDLLEIYFTSTREEGGLDSGDVWVARRASVDDEFGAPELVEAMSTLDVETSPAVSLDGLTMWIGSDRAGGFGEFDIWVSTRASRSDPWPEPTNVAELNSIEKDIPRTLGSGGLTMPLASHRDAGGIYWTYLASRLTPEAPFAEPELISELAVPGESVVDGFLSENGLTLYFTRTEVVDPTLVSDDEEPTGDLFLATRPSLREPFGPSLLPLAALNDSVLDERDLWISPDGKHVFFVSDAAGSRDIYEATLIGP